MTCWMVGNNDGLTGDTPYGLFTLDLLLGVFILPFPPRLPLPPPIVAAAAVPTDDGDDDFIELEEGFTLPSKPIAAHAAANAEEVFPDVVADFAGEYAPIAGGDQ